MGIWTDMLNYKPANVKKGREASFLKYQFYDSLSMFWIFDHEKHNKIAGYTAQHRHLD